MLVYIKPLSMFPKIHSDRLFGAIISAMSEIFPSEVDELIDKFLKNEPPFIISSAFPYFNINNEKKKFFPKIIINDNSCCVNQDIAKDFKKVEYIEEEIFVELINGNLSYSDILTNYGNYTRVNNLLMSKDYGKNIEIKSNIEPHNSINRLSNETKIFYNEGFLYGKHIGLFFYIKLFDDSYHDIICSCLKFLKDRGFGKDISSGKGHFDFEIKNIDLNFNGGLEKNDKFITLSRFSPNDEELKFINGESFYEIQSKRSIDKSGEIRKQVHFFKEGSSFPNYKKFYGKLISVGNHNPAFEYAYAFPIKYVDGVE